MADALVEMAGKPAKDIKVGFIPTAADADEGNKDWFIKQLTDLQKFGFEQIDIVELAAELVDWRQKLEAVDVVYAGGGNPYYLLYTMKKAGFDKWFREYADEKVYVGGSSGAIVMTPTIGAAKIKSYGSTNVPNLDDLSAFGFVDFEIAPHVPDWPSFAEAEKYAESTERKLYAIDNESGVRVIDGDTDIISEGVWRSFNT